MDEQRLISPQLPARISFPLSKIGQHLHLGDEEREINNNVILILAHHRQSLSPQRQWANQGNPIEGFILRKDKVSQGVITWNSPSMGLVLAAVSTLKNLLVLTSALSWPRRASVTCDVSVRESYHCDWLSPDRR